MAGRYTSQGVVRTLLVVTSEPVPTDLPHLFEIIKEMCIEDFIAKCSVEAFDVSILRRLARLDVDELHVVGFATVG